MNAAEPTIARRDLLSAGSVLSEGRTERSELIMLTDEELTVLGEVTSPGPGVWMPWIESDPQRAEAGMESVRRILSARRTLVPEGFAAPLEDREVEGDPARLVPEPRVAGILLLRRSAHQVTEVDAMTTIAGETVRAKQYYYHQTGGIALEEAIDGGGNHAFAVLPLATLPEQLAEQADPYQVAGADGEVRELPFDADATLDEEVIADTRFLLRITTSSIGGEIRRSVNIHATSDAVHITETVMSEGGEPQSLRVREVSTPSLQDVLREIVASGAEGP
jgi:hypothetical protein